MERDDYFVIQYRILKCLYLNFKQQKQTEPNRISAEVFSINETYWKEILYDMVSDGYVSGILYEKGTGNKTPYGIDSVRITKDGIKYVFSEPLMKEAENFCKENQLY